MTDVCTARPGRPRDESGAVIVEFSIVFILFALLIAGIIQYGVIFATEQSMTHAASEAVRSVVNIQDTNDDGPGDEAEAAAAEVIRSQLSWLDGDLDQPGADTDGRGVDYAIDTDPATASCPSCIDVEITFNWKDDAVVPSILPVGTPASLSAVSSIKFQ